MTDQSAVPAAGGGDTLTAVLDKKNEQIAHEIVADETLEHSRVRYTVRVPAQVFEAKVDEVLADVRRQASIPGFRPGKAPANLVRNRYLKAAREDAVRKIVPRLAELVAEERKVQVLAQPAFEGWDAAEAGAVDLKIVLEIRPEIVISDETLKDIAVEVEHIPVTDATVAHELEHLREHNAVFQTVEGAVYAPGDTVTISSEAREGDLILPEHFMAEERTDNPGRFLPPAVVEALKGQPAGARLTLENIELPPSANTGLSAVATFKVTIHDLKKRILPALDDEFAKDVSDKFQTLDDLKADIRKRQEEKELERRRTATLEKIYEILRERLTFAVPPTLVQNLANASIRRTEQELNQAGLSLRRFGRDLLDGYIKRVEGDSRVVARTLLIRDAVGRFLGVEATDELMDAEIARVAEQQGRKPLAVRAALEKNRQLEDLREELRARAIDEKLATLASVTVVEREADAHAHCNHGHDGEH
ncbi:MAG: trigger factor [Candidatus Sumerlaeia bacterium]|nr:trigger factor [Candidatus Sumerlaeia bacterium]